MHSNSRSWTSDEMVGALLAMAGLVALLVKSNLLQLKLNFPVPAPMAHVWPFALIAAGIALLWWQRKRNQVRAERSAENGEME